MDEVQRPIGVFDSGVGGISVLRELVALMPNENFIFYVVVLKCLTFFKMAIQKKP